MTTPLVLLALALAQPPAAPPVDACDALAVRVAALERLLGVDEAAGADADDAATAEAPLAAERTLRQAIRDVRQELLRLDQRLDAVERGRVAGGGGGDRLASELQALEREVADLRYRLRAVEMRR